MRSNSAFMLNQSIGFQGCSARRLNSMSRSAPCVKIVRAGCVPPSIECSSAGKDIKICGITSAKDAEMAAQAGADLIGVILWPMSKRSVSLSVAKEISKVARDCGAEPVGVFVDDNVNTILQASDASHLELLQLHGDGSHAALPILVQQYHVIYVLHADENGNLLNDAVVKESSLVDWFLVDSATGGRKQWQPTHLLFVSSRRLLPSPELRLVASIHAGRLVYAWGCWFG